jgi:Predicted glycosyltransferases
LIGGNILTSHRGVDEVDKGQYDKQRETDFTSGCAMFVRQEVFKKVGLFDKRYFLYLEDVDFCQRARRTGFKVIYTPRARLWHANAASSAVGGPLQDYYITRNRMLFGIRYAPWRTKIALFKESVKLLFAGRQWQRIGIRDFYLRKFGKGSYET